MILRVWKGVKQIIHCKSKLDKKITKIIHEGNEISDSTAIAIFLMIISRIWEIIWQAKFPLFKYHLCNI